MTDKISMIELFSGVGAQERALRQLGLPYEVINTCDCDAAAVLSYAAMRWDLENEMETFEFPSQDKMIEELQAKNLEYDFQKGKHGITKRTPINKLKQYYIADKLSSNLGDISKVEKLPYADIVTYSFCCQDLSVAGKGEGMKLNCDKCGHSWLVDFEHPENNSSCPNCGNTNIASTRSGLLGQVQRLLGVAKENNTLPKYLLLENVKNLVGKKFKPQFDAWVKWLDSIGYNTYYKVMNAKHYGICQNRERIFAISIRKDIDTKGYKFPEPIPLTTRLKDILEHNVDEKYYLSDDRIDKILNSSFVQEKKRIQTTDVCDTLLARDWKDPKCVPTEEEIQNGYNDKVSIPLKRGYSVDVSTYEPDSTEIDSIGNYSKSDYNATPIVNKNGIAPTVRENHGQVTAIIEPQVVKVGQASIEGSQCGTVYSTDDLAPTLTAGCHGYAMGYIAEKQEPFIVASRGRNPENPSDRTTGVPTEQRLEPNFSGCTNTLTSVQKDNYVCEPKIAQNPHGFNKGSVQEECPLITSSYFQENNYVVEPIIYDDYNSRVKEEQPKIRWRIRKLTPLECWRLMGFTDKDCNRASSYVSNSALYKQAGNSICTCCLIAIFSSLFLEDGYKSDVWAKYSLNYDD